jgi:tetratricopeptide (TPR) repeat protein
MSKEFLELSPEAQRAVEGYYNTALKSADHEAYDEAVLNLKKIHEILPYYKQSREMMDQYTKKLKEKQIVEATEKAKKDEKQELALLLEEGMDNLKEGEFDKAAEAFNSAITLDPNNQTALKGLKAAEYKVKRFEDIPPEKDPEQEKRKMVGDLFQQAVEAFRLKSYQQAIEKAEAIRKVELKGDTQYLNEAKQIIDKAKMLQKEEFEPFLIQAKEKFAEGDYNSSRDLCDEMLKRDPAYDEAKECVLKAKKQLNRLAKEAYTHGYILESMNRIEEAKQYWNRAKNYIRPGDDYYDKVNKKLEYYQ